jgi:hypothetical protein
MASGKLVAVDTPEGLRHRAFGGEILNLRTSAPLTNTQEAEIRRMPFVRGEIIQHGEQLYRIRVDEASTATPALLEWAGGQTLTVEAIEEYMPPFDDVFIELVKDQRNEDE